MGKFTDNIKSIFQAKRVQNNDLSRGLGGFDLNNNDGFMPLQINPDGKAKNDVAKYTSIYHLDRTRQDVAMWRAAVLEADQIYIPHRVKMQIMFEDTALNAQVQACMRKRKNQVLLKEFQFVNEEGEIDEATTKLFKANWFYKIQNYILDSIFFGYSLINWTNIKNGVPADIKLIRRQFISPDRRQISPFPYSLMGHSLDDADIQDWSLYVDTPGQHGLSPCGYGLLYECAMYEIILRNIMGYNGDYCEKYGMPITVVSTNKTDEDEREFLEKNIKSMASGSFIIKDPMDEVEIKGYDNVGEGFKSYADLEKRCEQKISKLLLGHADALDSTPGKLGGSQFAEESPVGQALDEVQTLDCRFVEYFVNDILLDKFRASGMAIPNSVKLEFLNNSEKQEQEEKENKNLINISMFVQTMFAAGFTPDEDWLEDKLGFKMFKVGAEQTTKIDEAPAPSPKQKPVTPSNTTKKGYDLISQIKEEIRIEEEKIKTEEK